MTIAYTKQVGRGDTERRCLAASPFRIHHPEKQRQKNLYQVFGVDLSTTITPEMVLLGEQNKTRTSTHIDYQIEPAGYQAVQAEIDLFIDQDSDEKWQGSLVGNALSGAGRGQLSYGAQLDPQQPYFVQTVLNRGTDIEIRGAKVLLKTLYADLDVDSDNNAGWQENGTQNLPSRNPLEDMAEDLPGLPGKVLSPGGH